MAPETFTTGIANPSYDTEPQPSEDTFQPRWQASDAALLLPNTIPKVQRAWERKPLNPFSRQRLRVGKVWKRTASSMRPNMSDAQAEDGGERKRRKARSSLLGQLKPVKKMCLESDFGMSARVLQWDAAESPVRKIVTRSDNSAQEMLALPDEDDVEASKDDVDVTVEILDDDGTVLDVGGEELAEQQDWEDEDAATDGDDEEAFDDTMMHLVDINDDAKAPVSREEDGTPRITGQDCTLEAQVDGSVDPEMSQQPVESNTPAIDLQPSQADATEVTQVQRVHFGKEDDKLPDGFVSPFKPLRTLAKKSARQSLGGPRRRTLPIQFAPISVADELVTPAHESSADKLGHVEINTLNNEQATKSTFEDTSAILDVETVDNETEQGWEDVDDDFQDPEMPDTENVSNAELKPESDDETKYTISEVSMVEAPDQEFEIEQNEIDKEIGTQVLVVQKDFNEQTKLPSSPIPTIEGLHPRLPLRRSPRRKSSSPLKQSTIMPSTEKPHLIAFTPLKGPAQYPSPSWHPGLHNPSFEEDDNVPEPASPIERAASAPPEEPQMSPQKPSKPRVSDDTALLQAFLNRAAESKTSRRISTSERESVTNRRDSDSVRQALASPAKAEVLGDLDPNSPSPRKPSTSALNASVFDGIDLGSIDATTEDEQIDDSRSTRRSERATRRALPSTPAAPNKIAIRGNAETVVLRRSEAQELALLTRNNTRKNKGGSVLPPIRLNRLASVQSNAETDAGAENAEAAPQGEKSHGARTVKWAETLVEFYQGGEVSEASILSDELSGPSQSEQLTKAESETVSAPPAPADTPSKPKIRRLRPTRTAATPGKAPPVPLAPPTIEAEKQATSEPQSKPKAKPSTKTRSRIATPAKGLTNASLLATDLDTQPKTDPAPSTEKKTAAPKKKAPSSKLPAPATATTTTTTSSLGQGKENLISSPPKKRTLPTAKTFAPKLDFTNSKTLLQPAAEEIAVPGLTTSPAKKTRGGKSSVFGTLPAADLGVEGREEVPLGLRSPAKKRTRRTAGA